MSPNPTRGGRFGAGIILLALLLLAAGLSFRIRLRAWPEILVPGYLWGRGWQLYRDIKVVHSPLSIAFVAAVSRVFGLGAASLRVLALLPVAGVLAGLGRYSRVREWRAPALVAAGTFFVATWLAWDGNAVYPEVFLAALSIPIYSALRRGEDRDIRLAGALFGIALSIKQPAVFAFLFAAIWIAARRPRLLPSFLLFAAAAPLTCLAFFFASGAGLDFLRWTIEVPIRYYRGRTSLGIQPAQAEIVLAGALPLAALLLLSFRRAGQRGPAILLAGLAAGFALLAFPHFEMVHLAASVPLLAVAAGEVFAPVPSPQVVERGGRQAGVRIVGAASVALSILLGAAFLATDASSGEISFWSSKEDDEAVARLAALPPAPLFLYGADQNLFIRSGRVPPGGLYSNPDLWVHYLVGGLEEEQIRILRDHPDTIVLRGRGTPIETPARRLPAFLDKEYAPGEFVRGGVRRLRPAGVSATR